MENLIDRIWDRKYVFFGTFFVVFTLSYLILVALDFLPEPPVVTNDEVAVVEQANLVEEASSIVAVSTDSTETTSSPDEEVSGSAAQPQDVSGPAVATVADSATLPLLLSIPKLDKKVSVLNPSSRTIADLDAALLDGVVRHPDSATLSQEGTVFLLGHSSYLPQVFNKNFQAFNGIQNLEWGDMIKVTSADKAYTYRVEKVYRAKAQDVTVLIAGSGHTLVLATCNSFGTKDDRYVVEAKQIGVEGL